MTNVLRPGEPVDWAHLQEPTFTRLLEALVYAEYKNSADVEPIDGRGGDGGADIRIRHNDGRLEVLQLKFFPEGFDGRFSGRRKQITNSLSAARKSQVGMSHWTLVFPAVPTASGWEFLKKLQAEHDDIHIAWLTKTHLDVLCSRHPSVVNAIARRGEYFLESMKAARLEEEVVASSLDLARRVDRLATLSEDMDPNWAVDFSVINGVRTHMLRARHPKAPAVSPITITPSFTFGPGDSALRSQVDRFLGFGGKDRVVLPGRVLSGLSVEGPEWLSVPSVKGVVEVGFFRSLVDKNESDWPPLKLGLRGPSSGEQFHAAPVKYVGSGPLGTTLETLVHRAVRLTFAFPEDIQATVRLDISLDIANASAYDAKNSVRFIRQLVGSERVSLSAEGKSLGSLTGLTSQDFGSRLGELAWIEEVASDFLEIENATGVSFDFSTDVAGVDRVDARILSLLLQGHSVRHRDVLMIPVQFSGTDEDVSAQAFLRGELGAFAATFGETVWEIAGQSVVLPELAIYHPRARLVGPSGVHPSPGDLCTIESEDGSPGWLYIPSRIDSDARLSPTPWGLTGIVEPGVVTSSEGIAPTRHSIDLGSSLPEASDRHTES